MFIECLLHFRCCTKHLVCADWINPHNNSMWKVLVLLTRPSLLLSDESREERWRTGFVIYPSRGPHSLAWSVLHHQRASTCFLALEIPVGFKPIRSLSWRSKGWTISFPASLSVEAQLTDCILQPTAMPPFSLDGSLCLQVNASSLPLQTSVW